MKNGFTIIELIVSIFILSIAVVGVFSAFSMVSILTSDMGDRLIATYLAQEGIEIVRNIRDTNWLNMDKAGCLSGSDPECLISWVEGLDGCVSGCGADYKSGFINPLNPSLSGAYLYINTNGFYDYNITGTGTQTKFKRKLKIDKITDVDDKDDHIIKVTVEVSWNRKATILSGGIEAGACQASNCIAAESTLYDWYNHEHH